jgi:oligopeptide transport system permease protein
MLRFILGRLAGGVVVVAAVATIAFFLMRAAPGGPFDEERSLLPEVQRNIEERYHLNDPVWEQYLRYMGGLLHGDLGHSLKRPQTVNEIIANQYGYTLTIGLMAISIGAGLGIAMGVTAARHRNSLRDHALMGVALLGISIPSIVLAPLLILIFSLTLGILPSARVESFASYLLPATTLGLIYTGVIARITRTSMVETMGHDFIRTARAKGLDERTVAWKHATRLGLIPVVTYLGPAVAGLISGSFVVEKMFQVPGLGSYVVNAVSDRDDPVLCGMLVFYVSFLVVLNIIVDITYGILDPRIRDRK